MQRETRTIIVSACTIVTAVLIFFWYIILGKSNLLHGNNLDVYYPQWAYYKLMLLSEGRVPLWSPYTYSGTPYQADVQTVLFYPLSLISLITPVLASLGWSAILHF